MRIGTDIVEVARIAQAIVNERKRFLERVFTINEIKEIDVLDPNYERAAGFWAAKESIVKAAGYGFSDGISFHDIEVTHNERGMPSFILKGRLKEIFHEKNITNISLSISHCGTHAIAATIIY